MQEEERVEARVEPESQMKNQEKGRGEFKKLKHSKGMKE